MAETKPKILKKVMKALRLVLAKAAKCCHWGQAEARPKRQLAVWASDTSEREDQA
jgi:hypothetical protein